MLTVIGLEEVKLQQMCRDVIFRPYIPLHRRNDFLAESPTHNYSTRARVKRGRPGFRKSTPLRCSQLLFTVWVVGTI